MTTTNWLGNSGDWGTAADWSNGVPDSLGVTAVLDGSTPYAVSIARGEAFTVGAVSVGDASATLAVAGALTLGGDLSLGGGTLDLAAGGEIVGGTIVTGSGVTNITGGALDRCTVVGTLNIGGAKPRLVVEGGLNLTAARGGAGEIAFGANGGAVTFSGSQTLDNATIVAGGAADSISSTGTLMLGAGLLLDNSTTGANVFVSGAYDLSHAAIDLGGSGAGILLQAATFVNDGSVDVSGANDFLFVGGASFTNHGSIVVSGAYSRFEGYAGEFINAADGRMTATSGGTIKLGVYQYHFDNLGTIVVEQGGVLALAGGLTTTAIGKVANSGVVELYGDIYNSGSTLTFGRGGVGGEVYMRGTIHGGVVAADSAGVDLQGALEGVQWRGPMDLRGYDYVTFTNGSTVTGANGTGPGTIRVDGHIAFLTFAGSQTLNNATVYLGTAGKHPFYSNSIVLEANAHGAATALTLGADARLVADAPHSKSFIFTYKYDPNDSIINDGTILAGAKGGYLGVGSGELKPNYVGLFVNNGDIQVSNGDYASFQFMTSFTNTGTISVTGGGSLSLNRLTNLGSIDIGAGCSLGLDGNYAVTTLGGIQNQGTLIIGGTIANAGQTITIGQGPLFGGQLTVIERGGSLDAQGAIAGGTLALGGGAIAWRGGALVGVKVEGPIDLSASGAAVALAGVTLTGAGGVGSGRTNATGANAAVYLDGTQSLDNATIVIGHAGADSQLALVGSGLVSVTLGAGVTVKADVAGSTIVAGYLDFQSTVALINRGTIETGAAGGLFDLEVPSFVNDGVLAVSNGDTVNVTATTTGTGAISLASASLTLAAVSSGETLTFADGAGSLALSAASAFNGLIAGLQTGDRIDLSFVKGTSLSLSGGVLEVLNGGTVAASLSLAGAYQIGDFALKSDGAGGSLITVNTSAARRGSAGPVDLAAMSQAMASLAGFGPGLGPATGASGLRETSAALFSPPDWRGSARPMSDRP